MKKLLYLILTAVIISSCGRKSTTETSDALTLKHYVNSEDFRNAKVSYPEKKEELKKLADSLDETDNPVLIVVTPKE